jgi:hypothetical protein
MSRARKLVEGALKKLDEASAKADAAAVAKMTPAERERHEYLPLSPQELLTAYLELVGVSPADAYGAQVTYDRPFDLMGRTSTKRGVRRTGGGPDLPCADGKPRQRMAEDGFVPPRYCWPPR